MRSHWDRLPRELRDMTAAAAGPLTAHLCGAPVAGGLAAAWRDALASGWAGDLSLLPDPADIAPLAILRNLALVQTREAFLRLQERFAGSERMRQLVPHVAMRHMWLDLVDMTNPDALARDAAYGGHMRLLWHLLVEERLAHPDLELSIIAASAGRTRVLRLLFGRFGRPRHLDQVLYNAAYEGHLATLQWLLAGIGMRIADPFDDPEEREADPADVLPESFERGLGGGPRRPAGPIGDDAVLAEARGAFVAACAGGQVAAVRWLLAQDSDIETAAGMDRAARYGNVAVVELLHRQGERGCTTDAMDGAAAGGYLRVVQFLHEHRQEGCTTDALDQAAARGRLDVVRFLHAHRTEGATAAAMDGAAAGGHLDVVKFLHEHRQEGCTADAVDLAAANGHADVVAYLLDHCDADCSPSAAFDAAAAGSLDAARLLCERRAGGCSAQQVLETAERRGRADVAAWARTLLAD
ncbi:hypothetical protein HK105_208786 [Polyrhizophydium stewartii]|uniref:Ankyrin repeat domain-containing protein n=1 Tax=Polyrhizophydium stewartii TaxID=2732419 RepID=A0ABR4MWV8_9FUNG